MEGASARVAAVTVRYQLRQEIIVLKNSKQYGIPPSRNLTFIDTDGKQTLGYG